LRKEFSQKESILVKAVEKVMLDTEEMKVEIKQLEIKQMGISRDHREHAKLYNQLVKEVDERAATEKAFDVADRA
jgi:hypothetical protein